MPVRLLGWIAVLLLSGGCSILFGSTQADIEGEDCTVSCDVFLADACEGAACKCGVGPQCTQGLQCLGGACVCTNQTCPTGCCSEVETCRTGDSLLSCGEGGIECKVCDPITADKCGETGDCQCGDGFACIDGKHCVAGECICDSTSCDGCCTDQDECVADGSQDSETCGTAGEICDVCPSKETCNAGVCSGCADECMDGCCSGTECIQAGPGATACNGLSGDACLSCGITANGCSPSGVCACDGGNQCKPGQICAGGANPCVCNAESCPDGCCDDNGQCLTASDEFCGIAGASCTTCGEGLRCDVGECICDSMSCGNGCCSDSDTGDTRACIQKGSPENTCGINGGACVICPPEAFCSVDGTSCLSEVPPA